MQTDFHRYHTIVLAKATGFHSWAAQIIANACENVDHADHEGIIVVGSQLVEMTMTSHKLFDIGIGDTQDTLKPWVGHFIPEGRDSTNFYERMRCQKNGILIPEIVDDAISYKDENFFLHLVGATLHGAIQDPRAHWDFIGLGHKSNKIKQSSLIIKTPGNKPLGGLRTFQQKLIGVVGEKLPIGHIGLGKSADWPFALIKYETEDGRKVVRDNVTSFTEAAEATYNFLIRVLEANPKYGKIENAHAWEDLSKTIENLLSKTGSLKKRINNWRKLIESGEFFQVTPIDKRKWHVAKAWGPDQIIRWIEKGRDPKFCNALLFNTATRIYYDLIIKAMDNHGFILS